MALAGYWWVLDFVSIGHQYRRPTTGEVPEWSNGPDSKSGVRLHRTVGSNPTLSAKMRKGPFVGPFAFLPRGSGITKPVRRAQPRSGMPGREAPIPPSPPDIEKAPMWGLFVYRMGIEEESPVMNGELNKAVKWPRGLLGIILAAMLLAACSGGSAPPPRELVDLPVVAGSGSAEPHLAVHLGIAALGDVEAVDLVGVFLDLDLGSSPWDDTVL